MKEIKLTIDGKEVRLTDEPLRMLGIEAENKKNPFERVNPDVDDKYYYIRVSGDVAEYRDVNDNADRLLYEVSNYFNDKAFAEQVALHQLLYRKLLKFSYDNECEGDQPWDCENGHYHVYYSHAHKIFKTELNYEGQHPGVYFPSQEAAKRAIKEVIEPFMKEHPEFVW